MVQVTAPKYFWNKEKRGRVSKSVVLFTRKYVLSVDKIGLLFILNPHPS